MKTKKIKSVFCDDTSRVSHSIETLYNIQNKPIVSGVSLELWGKCQNKGVEIIVEHYLSKTFINQLYRKLNNKKVGKK